MIHGHASFLGIVPLMLGIASLLGLVAARRTLPAFRVRAIVAWTVRHRIALASSLAIGLAYASPILLHTVLHWPGEFGRYWAFIGLLPPQPPGMALRYEISFLPAGGLWLALFLRPAGRDGRHATGDLRAAGLVVFFAAALPAFWYSWREVDDVQHRYLLLWLAPFAGTALVAALFHAARASDLTPGRRILFCVVLGGLSLPAVLGAEHEPAIDAADNLVLRRTVDRLLAGPAPTGSDRTELVLDRSPAAWVPAWTETVEILDALKRAGRRDFCVSAATWHILFEQDNRCDPARDHIVGRFLVTLWPAAPPPSSVRLGQVGMLPLPPR